MLDAGVVSETAVQPSRDIVLILHHAADAAAVWLATALREHIGDRVLLLTIDELMYSKSIQHHFDSSLDESTFKLFDGREIRSACIAGVINRLCTPPDRHLEQVAQADRLYSTQELHAFWLGWLNSLPVPVINPPRPNALLGLSADEVVLQHTAATAGLPCQPLEFEVTSIERPVAHGNGAHGNSAQGRVSGRHVPGQHSMHALEEAGNLSLLVFDDRVFGPIVSASLSMAAIRFARLLGLSLVQIDFRFHPSGQLRFQQASALADLRIGGHALVRRLAAALLPQLFDIQERVL